MFWRWPFVRQLGNGLEIFNEISCRCLLQKNAALHVSLTYSTEVMALCLLKFTKTVHLETHFGNSLEILNEICCRYLLSKEKRPFKYHPFKSGKPEFWPFVCMNFQKLSVGITSCKHFRIFSYFFFFADVNYHSEMWLCKNHSPRL